MIPTSSPPRNANTLNSLASEGGIEREIWLWDFAGQYDYRLIHQLFMNDTALAILMFNPQNPDPFEGLGQWDRDLQQASRDSFRKLLVAGRVDRGGLMIGRGQVETFLRERGFEGYLETSAMTGKGCDDLRKAIVETVLGDQVKWTASPRIYKALKDHILKLKDKGYALLRIAELRQQLEMSMSGEAFTMDDLHAVVRLLASPGAVWPLEFGDFVLLQPERINAYAAAVVRSVRAHENEIGEIPKERVLAGDLDYQDVKRLNPEDEVVVLRAMYQTLIKHGLCLRVPTESGEMLVFPSYYKRERPELGTHPDPFVSYAFTGPLDEIYATLVVRLHHTTAFGSDRLYRFAADFKTHFDKRIGLKMTKTGYGSAEITVYLDPDVGDDTKVTFERYVREHLHTKALNIERLRHFVCRNCGWPVDRKLAMKKLHEGHKDMLCANCEGRVLLWDAVEQKFASDDTRRRVHALEKRSDAGIATENRELILINHAYSIAQEAGLVFSPSYNPDRIFDGEIAVIDYRGVDSGRRIFLLLRPGSYIELVNQKTGEETVTIRGPLLAAIRRQRAGPVMVVNRSQDGSIVWMNVSPHVMQGGASRRKFQEIVFEGELFTALNLQRLRDQLIALGR